MAIVKSVVFDPPSEELLEELSIRLKKSRSRIVKEALLKYAEEVMYK